MVSATLSFRRLSYYNPGSSVQSRLEVLNRTEPMNPECTLEEAAVSPLDMIDQLFFLAVGIYAIYMSQAKKNRYSEKRAGFLMASGIIVIALAALITVGELLHLW